jgi:hypothetical protein
MVQPGGAALPHFPRRFRPHGNVTCASTTIVEAKKLPEGKKVGTFVCIFLPEREGEPCFKPARVRQPGRNRRHSEGGQPPDGVFREGGYG